jgi:hypothetical protein
MLVDTLDENVSENLLEEYKTRVYRIVQEALNNCSKHAYAKNVRVVVRQEPNHLRVSIKDDEKGFDASRVRGLRLVGMNERMSQMGGVLKVESDPARGTRLRVDLPLPNASADSGELSGFVNDGYQSAMRKETLAGLPQLVGFLKTKAARKTEPLPVLSACDKFFGDTWFPFVTAAVIINHDLLRAYLAKPIQESSLSRDSHNSRRSAATRRKWRARKGRERSHHRIYRKGGNGIVDLVGHVQEAAARIERHSKRMLAGWNWS